jgi:acyl-coenzyme A thioesterase PaaI-like protein
MNQLERTVHQFRPYPASLLSFVIGRLVPFTGTAGVRYEKMSRHEVIVSLKNKRSVRNHIRQVHAAAMMLLAETATGMVVGMNIPDDKIPLLKSMQSDFVQRSSGAIRAVATLSEQQIAPINAQDKGTIQVPVTITDDSGNEPVVVIAVWAWVPKKRP